jgi:hypothetical protein
MRLCAGGICRRTLIAGDGSQVASPAGLYAPWIPGQRAAPVGRSRHHRLRTLRLPSVPRLVRLAAETSPAVLTCEIRLQLPAMSSAAMRPNREGWVEIRVEVRDVLHCLVLSQASDLRKRGPRGARTHNPRIKSRSPRVSARAGWCRRGSVCAGQRPGLADRGAGRSGVVSGRVGWFGRTFGRRRRWHLPTSSAVAVGRADSTAGMQSTDRGHPRWRHSGASKCLPPGLFDENDVVPTAFAVRRRPLGCCCQRICLRSNLIGTRQRRLRARSSWLQRHV